MDDLSDFGHTQRTLLQTRAGALYQKVAASGGIPSDDPLIVAEPDSTALLTDLGLLALENDTYVAIDPALVQSRVVTPLWRQAADLLAESTGWAQSFAELGQAFRRTTADGVPVTEIRGLPNINRYLQAVVGDAQQELLTAQPAGARSAATLTVAAERDIKALERGLSMRTLYQHSARRNLATREYVAQVTEHGGQVRTLDEFFNRLIVVDRRLAIVPGAEGTQLAIAIHEPNLVAYLADIFERYWERAHAFTDREPSTQRSVADDVHNMTVRMLVEGHSDNASAKRMGVSTRTYAGYIAALKLEYAVETRFQLGHAMAKREAEQDRPPDEG